MPDHGRDSNLTLTFVPIPRSVYDQLVSRHEHGTRRIKRFGRLPSSQCHNGGGAVNIVPDAFVGFFPRALETLGKVRFIQR